MASRKVSLGDKNLQKAVTEGPIQSKSGECEICQSAVEAEDKRIECEVCKGWYHTTCVDITDNEYEVLATHKMGFGVTLLTVHWVF